MGMDERFGIVLVVVVCVLNIRHSARGLCGLTTTPEKKSQQHPNWRLPTDIGLCRNIGLDLYSRDGGSGLRSSGFECGPDFFIEKTVAPTSLGAGGLRDKIGAVLSGDRERPNYSTPARLTDMQVRQGLCAQPSELGRRCSIL
jgi:hypothetical protein